jgi:hypothetical protein
LVAGSNPTGRTSDFGWFYWARGAGRSVNQGLLGIWWGVAGGLLVNYLSHGFSCFLVLVCVAFWVARVSGNWLNMGFSILCLVAVSRRPGWMGKFIAHLYENEDIEREGESGGGAGLWPGAVLCEAEGGIGLEGSGGAGVFSELAGEVPRVAEVVGADGGGG